MGATTVSPVVEDRGIHVRKGQEVSLPADPASVRAARTIVGEMAASGPGEPAQLATLLTSELVTNAVLHAGTSFQLRVVLSEGALRVEVTDASSAVPVVKHYDESAPTGRGLRMVSTSASRWGVDRTDEGKTVWFELDGPWTAAGRSAP
jgi:anti-sigma regulatory factor (Ser/Thr protein kinase)